MTPQTEEDRRVELMLKSDVWNSPIFMATGKRKTFDPECYHLASYFLCDVPAKDTEKNRNELATQIQQLVEDWMENEEEDCHV